MSGRLVSCVFESRLTHRLKTLAAVLATFGRDDGTSIRPSVVRVARLWGRSERRTHAALADLQALGVLVVVQPHAPHRPTEYRLDLIRLAQLPPPPPAQQPRHQLVLPLFAQVFPRRDRTSQQLTEISTGMHRSNLTIATANLTLASPDPLRRSE